MFFNNIASMYKDASGSEMDRGDLVQTIIIVATFAVVAIAVIGLIGNAIMTKGKTAADCITAANVNVSGTSTTPATCAPAPVIP